MSRRRHGGPRRLSTLDGLPDHAAAQAREDLARALRRHERTPAGLRGEESGAHVPYRLTFDDHGVFLDLLTPQADSRRAAWARYWTSHTTDRGAYDTTNAAAAAGAPERPTYETGDVVAATWTQVRDWLAAPEQLHLFDTRSAAA